MTLVLGIAASHNGAACLMRNGEIVVAVQEERLSRRKRDAISLDRRSEAVEYCLATAGISPADLAMVVVCSQDRVERLDGLYLLEEQLATSGPPPPRTFIGHHAGHMLSALALSGWDSCAGLVIDGMGSAIADLPEAERAACHGDADADWECISLYAAADADVRPIEKLVAGGGLWLGERTGGMREFSSLGGMYASVAEQIFGDLSKAGHVMGLAPFGKPSLPPECFLRIGEKGIDYARDASVQFAHDERWPHHSRVYEDLAASAQAALEVAILHLARRLWELTRNHRLCFSGGVALNAIANERLHRETPFREIFIPAAAEDSGTSVGAAFWGTRQLSVRQPRRRIRTDGLGPRYQDIGAAIAGVPGLLALHLGDDVYATAAGRLAQGEICGWFQNGSELGPRALGNRSILADPRSVDSRERLNSRVKHREWFRPFAPAVLNEHTDTWFETAHPGDESEFMLRIWPVRPHMRADVAAIVHVDGSSRPQTVTAEALPEFYRLIAAFYEMTGVPMLLNTSFNVDSEPIVETPEDALWCFLLTDLDFCVLSQTLVTKGEGLQALGAMRPTLSPTTKSAIESGDVLTPVQFVAGTRWGPQARSLASGARLFLREVDGRRTVADIARVCGDMGISSTGDPGLLRLFAHLRRTGAIELDAAGRPNTVGAPGDLAKGGKYRGP